MRELRCGSKKHAVVSENSIGEISIICNSRFCKTEPDEITEHVWDLTKISKNGTINPTRTNHFKREVRIKK